MVPPSLDQYTTVIRTQYGSLYMYNKSKNKLVFLILTWNILSHSESWVVFSEASG